MIRPDLVEALLALAEHPDRDDIVRSLSMKLLKERMTDTFDVLVGHHVDYLLIFIDSETRHAASLSNMTQNETLMLVDTWLEINARAAANDEESER